VLVAQHDDDSGPGLLEAPLRLRGCDLRLWFPPRAPPPPLDGVAGVIVLGAHAGPDDPDAQGWIDAERRLVRDALDRGIPYLGICFGAELLAEVAGGRTASTYPARIGWRPLEVRLAAGIDPLLEGLASGHPAFQWHEEGPESPPAAALLATSEGADQAFRVGDTAWGLHFHPEVDMTAVALWSVLGRDQLDRAGVDPEALRAETARNEAGQIAFARLLADRFADLIGAEPAGDL
jgi:GMP synthase-like glutamine amidotransferase